MENETETENLAPLGVEVFPEGFKQKYGKVKIALEQNANDENTSEKSHIETADVKNAQIIELAIRGHSKRKISEVLKCSVTSVERHVYSSQGQLRLAQALETTQASIDTSLPLLVAQALVTLEDVLNGGDVKKLQAVDRILSLHSRIAQMAHLQAPVVKTSKTQTVNAE